VWVVDPIDGTRAYMAGREDWSISAALVEDGRPVAAALYAPATEELFLATAGGGATRNNVPINASDGSLAGARIAGPKRMLEHIAARTPSVIVVPRIHSLALRLARVAQGEIDAAVAGGSGHDWDLAAADLLVHEAGGMITAVDGKPLIYNRPAPVHGVLMAAGRERHHALIAIVRTEVGKAERQ
jgi:myo-inositol-1(or 4)-monophosphatase